MFSSRRRHGLTVTPVMQEMLREILSWHARTCGEALVGGIFQVCTTRNTAAVCVCVALAHAKSVGSAKEGVGLLSPI